MKITTQAKATGAKTESPPKLSKEEIAARVQSRFGDIAKSKAPAKKIDTVELSGKGIKSSDEGDFGDVGKNDPKAEVTQEKLKSILQNGGFHFNDKERQALGQILK